MCVLELKNISVGYGTKTILQDVSMEFKSGQIYAVLGKNGCGKSTLLKACADMLPRKQGELLLHGKPLNVYLPKERAKEVSYLSQHRNTPSITVERLLIHGRHPHMSHGKQMGKEDWCVLEQVMEMMEIGGFRQELLSELSGGERQRVYLAMVLAQDTPVLLLDEPTTYMDISYQLQFLELLETLKKQGKTIVLVLHDLPQALQVADWVVLLDQGQVAVQGTPKGVLASGKIQECFGVSMVTGTTQDGEIVITMKRE